MKIWKRNAVVSVIVLFVCVAMYLSWSYGRVPDGEDAQVFDPGKATVSPSASPDAGSLNEEGIGEETGANQSTDLSAGYFSEARLARQQARDSAITILREAADREDASQEIKDNATSEIEKLAQNAMLEATVENLIVAKGFTQCVAFINNDGISLVVAAPDGGLTATDAAKIKDVVISQTSMTALDIHITEVPA